MLNKYRIVYWGVNPDKIVDAIYRKTFLGVIFSIIKLRIKGCKVFYLDVVKK